MGNRYVPGRDGKTKNQEDKRTITLSVRVSEGELARLRALAKASHMQVAEYLRACALLASLPPQVPPINQQKWAELSRMASNLTQLAQAANAGFVLDKVDILPALSELKTELKRLRLLLIGGNDQEVKS